MPWEIKTVKAGEPPRRIPISRTTFLIGRHSSCHLQLMDCTLSADGDHLRIEDGRSLNGTLVNCRRIESATELRPGDVVRIGPFLFLVLYSPGDTPDEDAGEDVIYSRVARSPAGT
jgi:pSer/pThr/pTyr-binding forkhead associated (FHA) protein